MEGVARRMNRTLKKSGEVLLPTGKDLLQKRQETINTRDDVIDFFYTCIGLSAVPSPHHVCLISTGRNTNPRRRESRPPVLLDQACGIPFCRPYQLSRQGPEERLAA